MNVELHKKVIEEQTALADEAGKRIAQRLLKIFPLRQMIAISANGKVGRPELALHVTRMLTNEYIRLIDAPTNETLRIGHFFAKEKLDAVSS